jgi:hypothetical protein
MGMTVMFRRLSGEDLSRLREEPGLVADYLQGEEPEGFGPFADLDVDKAWHAIHFLLTGSAWEGDPPLNFIVIGGSDVGDDLGYGPARGLSSDEVRNLAGALRAIATLRPRRADGRKHLSGDLGSSARRGRYSRICF